MEVNLNLEDLLAKLKNDSESKSNRKLRKIIMNSPEVVGSTINALPILIEGNLYYKLDAVREFNTSSKFYRNGENDTWIRLLDKASYGELTADEVELWKKTKDSLENLISKVDDFYTARFRKYTLIPVYITKFIDPNGAENPDMKGTSLLVFPSHAPIKALNSAITMMSNNSGGNQWMPLVLSPTLKGRQGALSIKFSKSTTTKGYDCAITVVMNGEWTKVVDPSVDYSEGIEFNPVREFLAWQATDEKLFNKDIIQELYESSEFKLNKINKKKSENTEQPNTVEKSDENQVVNTTEPEITKQEPNTENTPF
jgi:hypothetical protein